VPLYSPSLPVRAAREQYFRNAGFDADGGYSSKWVKLKIGPAAVAFPNSKERVRSVKLHDIHHVLTEYDTSWTGEAEIAAWELASNCRTHWAAWVLDGGAFLIGLLIAPRRTLRAFVRGWKSRNLYHAHELDEALLDKTVGELREALRLPAASAAGSSSANQ
jgi:hypothetical protein